MAGFRGALSGARTCLLFVFAAASCTLVFLSFFGLPATYLPKPILYLGKISVGLYVFHLRFILLAERLISALSWHNAILNMLAIYVVAFAGTIAAASLSYRFFEKPFLKWKDRFTFVPSR